MLAERALFSHGIVLFHWLLSLSADLQALYWNVKEHVSLCLFLHQRERWKNLILTVAIVLIIQNNNGKQFLSCLRNFCT